MVDALQDQPRVDVPSFWKTPLEQPASLAGHNNRCDRADFPVDLRDEGLNLRPHAVVDPRAETSHGVGSDERGG